MPDDLTAMLVRWGEGDRQALDDALPQIYDELRRLAGGRMRAEQREVSVQATVLVHEAYLKLVNQARAAPENRVHFFGMAARAMRQVLVDQARSRRAAKRGAGENLQLVTGMDAAEEPALDVLALNEALDELAEFDERKARIVELKYFSGMRAEEISEVMGISLRTIGRELQMAQAWLRRAIRKSQ